MAYTVERLLELLDLEPLEQNIYRGRNRDIGSGRVFGGQVLAQALVAARRTVEEEDREAHSIHGYFILAGELDVPIVYFVNRLRDGRSFTTRHVTAIQNGSAIFDLVASFHARQEGPEHQLPMPAVPPPEQLRPELELIRDAAERIPEPLRGVLTQDRPIDFRPVSPLDPVDPEPSPPAKYLWFRALGDMPSNTLVHQAVMAYASDYGLLGTVLQPHGLSIRSPRIQVASLDHALWFHRSFRVDDWLLYAMDSPAACGGRGFARGSIFTRDGVLVASVAQEGLMRYRRR